jgi:hypothetical protein
LEHLITLSGQPDSTDDIRAIFQSLVNALIKTDGFRLSPDDLASLYGDLVLSQPSSSSGPEYLAIHQTLLDSISVVDDILEDRAMAREALLKEKENDASQQKEKPRHRVIPERQTLVDLLRRLVVSHITALVSLLLIRCLQACNTLSPDFCALNLDYGLLQDVGLLRDSVQISGKEVRARTRLMCAMSLVGTTKQAKTIFAHQLQADKGQSSPRTIRGILQVHYRTLQLPRTFSRISLLQLG